MSSPDNTNPFGTLSNETPALGRNEAADQSQAGMTRPRCSSSAATTELDVTTLGSALDEVASGTDKGRKRPATESPVRYSSDLAKKQYLEIKAKQAKARQEAEDAAKSSQPAPATAAATQASTAKSTSAPPIDGAEMEMDEEKEVVFPFKNIPKWARISSAHSVSMENIQ